jgi:hypothetical protein
MCGILQYHFLMADVVCAQRALSLQIADAGLSILIKLIKCCL